ncbi:MAG: hypothetical protein JXA82_17240 [Sedimentisphaerales bacterium]|nr:hypothetical protein [Sedimentisphaerales bacterium]
MRMSEFLCLTMLAAGITHASEYEITWYTIDGGGGTSTGGPYELVGTIGQTDTGVSSADPHVLSAGFWPGNFGCVVNLTDLMLFMEQWLSMTPGASFSPADFDQSGDVDISDFAVLSAWWFDYCPADWSLK